MNPLIKLTLFATILLGLLTVLTCTENDTWFTFSFATICTTSGVFLGQLIKQPGTISPNVLWKLCGMFVFAIAVSVCMHLLIDDYAIKVSCIALTNLILALTTLSYMLYFRKR